MLDLFQGASADSRTSSISVVTYHGVVVVRVAANAETRTSAAEVLGLMRVQSAVEPLVQFAASNVGDVPTYESYAGSPLNAAIYSLGTIGDPRAVGPLLELLTFKVAASTSLEALGKIIKDRACDVSEADLRALADLQQVISLEYDSSYDGDDWAVRPPPVVERPLDCSPVRQLAQQELRHRARADTRP